MTPAQIKELEELAAGFEASALAEQVLVEGLMPIRKDWNARRAEDQYQPHDLTTRLVRVQLDAEATVRRSRKSAEAIRAALAALTSAHTTAEGEPAHV